MKRIVLILSFIHVFMMTIFAQKMTCNAPQQVAVGQQFRLS